MPRIRPCLWFDTQAEEAARLYTSIFPDSSVGTVTRHPNAGEELRRELGGPETGSVMTVDFTLSGQPFTALNGGPVFHFTEAISFEVECADQAELDRYWDQLSEGGDPAAQQCGWLKDRFGVSWQIVPRGWQAMVNDPDPARVERVFEAMLQMQRLDIAALQRAFDG